MVLLLSVAKDPSIGRVWWRLCRLVSVGKSLQEGHDLVFSLLCRLGNRGVPWNAIMVDSDGM
jgi:hypothetical protein